MFNNMISFFYKLTYYFMNPININLDTDEQMTYNLYETRLQHMTDITKYFVWRKYTLFLCLPFIFSNFVLNIVNFFYIKENIEKYQNQTDDLGSIKNKTQHFIDFLNSGKTLDYILFYNIFSAVFLLIEIILKKKLYRSISI